MCLDHGPAVASLFYGPVVSGTPPHIGIPTHWLAPSWSSPALQVVVATNVVVVTILTRLMMNNKSLVNFSDLYNNSYLFIY